MAGEYEERTFYTYNLQYQSFEEARQQCLDDGAVLAQPDSPTANEELRQFAEDHYPLPTAIKNNPRNKENWVCC